MIGARRSRAGHAKRVDKAPLPQRSLDVFQQLGV
jgi:hypothetical protein